MVLKHLYFDLEMNFSGVNGVGEESEEEGSACRVKPLDLESFRKRKLFVPGMLTPKSGKRFEFFILYQVMK